MIYSIVKTDGTVLGITDSVRYIKIHENGCYTNATEDDAIGIAFKSKPYNLAGHSEIEGADEVIVVETTLDAILKENNSSRDIVQDDTDAMLVDHEYRLTLLELFTDTTT